MAKISRTYLDWNATAPLMACARDAMLDVMDSGGNASSVHFEGRNARKSVEVARKSLAGLLDCDPSGIVFTSGATEAANHVLSPLLRAGGQAITVSRLYMGATEHPCVMSGGRFRAEDCEILPVTQDGRLDLSALENTLENHDHAIGAPMVAVQLANNETGVVQPVAEIADIVHGNDGFLVVDAVQALGKLSFNLAETGADFLFVSSHKIGGPQGAGALVLRTPSLSPQPLLEGGGQENYHRAGTENVASIAGFGAACEWHAKNMTKKVMISGFRDSIEEQIVTISQETGNRNGPPVFFGKTTKRLGNTSCFAVPGIRAETALMALDLDGVSLSSGSACSSGKVKTSHVLAAMGAGNDELEGALRLSLGWESDGEDAERFLKAWNKLASRLAA
ncbi:MAG: cysteine desulfurase [Rhizobiaceae bacterium]|nr:cysteine desulfurase [Rhizobiaceae bacterium]